MPSALVFPLAGELCPRTDERGFSLIEVLVAVIIAVIAVLGLAHSFGAGRALINRYETARAASALVEGRLETLATIATKDPSDPQLTVGTHGPAPIMLGGERLGQESWFIEWVDDPLDGLGAGDLTPNDYKRVTATITWTGSAVADTVQLTRLLRVP
jgi:prepilin-type N-terminal cleavage/methylation domain-containing protein